MTAGAASFVTGVGASLKRRGLPANHKHLVIAVSGGADSVALLLAMRALRGELRLRITVGHLDHGLRGKEGRQDAQFVAALAKRLRFECVPGGGAVGRRAKRKHLSLELAAREARYRFLFRVARDKGATAIVTAHTADDQAETVLLRLARGSGASGLAGIRPEGRVSELGLGIPRSDVALLRPLLDVSRADIEAYLRREGQAWREDPTNVSAEFLRNRVRHEVLPVLAERLNPSVSRALCRTAEILAEEERWLDGLVVTAFETCVDAEGRLFREAVDELPPALARRVVRKWLASAGLPTEKIDFSMVERVRELAGQAAGSREAGLPGPWRAIRRYGRLSVEAATSRPAPFRVGLNVAGETLLPDQGLRVIVSCATGIVRETGNEPGCLPASASLSRCAVGRRRLYLRSVQAGDRMQPYGMKGTRKLQDVLVDAKVPADWRSAVPVLECGGEIAWIPGYRIAHPFRVHDGEGALQISVDRL